MVVQIPTENFIGKSKDCSSDNVTNNYLIMLEYFAIKTA
jgi:hypothetical protein